MMAASSLAAPAHLCPELLLLLLLVLLVLLVLPVLPRTPGGGSCGSDMTMPAAAAGMLMATAAEALSG